MPKISSLQPDSVAAMREVQVFRLLSAKAELYALGDLTEPVRQFEPIEPEFFPTVQAAVDYANGRGWKVIRIER